MKGLHFVLLLLAVIRIGSWMMKEHYSFLSAVTLDSATFLRENREWNYFINKKCETPQLPIFGGDWEEDKSNSTGKFELGQSLLSKGYFTADFTYDLKVTIRM